MIDNFNKFFENKTNDIINNIKRNLTPDLLKGIWKNDNPKDYAGYCYVATEALYWLLGGPNSNYRPYVLGNKEWSEVLNKGETHWFLKNIETGEVLDPTKEQFGENKIPYDLGRPNGMMNFPKGGSKRARILMDRL